MKAQFKTKTEQGQIEITKNNVISQNPYNITLKGIEIEKVRLVVKNGMKLFVEAFAWQLVPAFPQLKAVNGTQSVAIQILDLNGNEIEAYGLSSMHLEHVQLSLDNLIKNNNTGLSKSKMNLDEGNFGTGFITTWNKAIKYGYDAIER